MTLTAGSNNNLSAAWQISGKIKVAFIRLQDSVRKECEGFFMQKMSKLRAQISPGKYIYKYSVLNK